MSRSVVIIGGGQAGFALANKLRQLDDSAEILIIGEEPHLPYQRPPLSKKFMTGEMEAETLSLRPARWYHDMRVRVLTQRCVTGIDVLAKTVSLDNNEALPYDKLVFATGSRPIKLPAAIGGDLGGVYYLRGIDDVDRIRNELVSGHRALVIGGGFIGLEAAAAFRKLGLNVCVVEMGDRILQRVVCTQTSDYFRELHIRNSVEIREKLRVARLVGHDGHVRRAEFENGDTMDVDFVLVGIGVTANDGLAKTAGIATENGILVNSFCQTSGTDVYAAGDCTRFQFRGQSIRLESVQNAIDQAECAAQNIAGASLEYLPKPYFWSDQYEAKLQIAGLSQRYDRVIGRPGSRQGSRSVWYFDAGEFVAVDAINEPRAFIVGKKILADGGSLSPEQISDEQFDLKLLL